MDRSAKPLEKGTKSTPFKKSLNLLEIIVALYALAIIVLGFLDISFRSTLEDIALMVISGYLGNKIPR